MQVLKKMNDRKFWIHSGGQTNVSRLSFILVFFLAFYSCKQEETRGFLENDPNPPGDVTDISIKNLPGGAKISYEIPTDMDLLYIQAEYEIRKGVKQETQSSFYKHFIEVDGFGNTGEKMITLYTVDRSGNRSKGIEVKIKPLTPPVQSAYASLAYIDDFGGINVTYDNPTRSELVTTILLKDNLGDWLEYDKNYTSVPQVDFSVRGLPSERTTFGVFIRDKWGNLSDTLVQDLTPLVEEQLDKKKFKQIKLPTDPEITTWAIETFWNDKRTSGGFHTAENQGVPAWVTIDLGVTTRLSRLKVWQVHDGREYSSGNVRQFEIWGTDNPDPDGGWENWELLQECEIIKPSGLPTGELSNEDQQEAANGHEFSVSGSAPAIRYIRLKVISTFSQPSGSSTGSSWLREITLWGQGED